MTPKFKIGAITDEFSPDLQTALDAMSKIGMTGAELRVVWGKNIMDLSEDELSRAKDLIQSKNMETVSIASPLLKCVLPNAPDIDTRFQQDIFNSKHTFDDQPRLADHAVHVAKKFGAKIIRVFSYWRTVNPEACYDQILDALRKLSDLAAQHDLIIGLENEHACNIGTAVESAKILSMLEHPNLKLVWDPANAFVGGENPYPFGYELLPKSRIAHIHVKDCHMEGHTPIWGPVGTRHVDWKGHIAALQRDGYDGFLNLETHWTGSGGCDKFQASTICGWNLRGLASL